MVYFSIFPSKFRRSWKTCFPPINSTGSVCVKSGLSENKAALNPVVNHHVTEKRAAQKKRDGIAHFQTHPNIIVYYMEYIPTI